MNKRYCCYRHFILGKTAKDSTHCYNHVSLGVVNPLHQHPRPHSPPSITGLAIRPTQFRIEK